MAELRPMSLLCRLEQDHPHRPCSGTLDDGSGGPCQCRCHTAKFPNTGQTFPAGALTGTGDCAGLCGRQALEVCLARLTNPTVKQELSLCAECLADVLVAAPMLRGRVCVLAVDGAFHECAADV